MEIPDCIIREVNGLLSPYGAKFSQDGDSPKQAKRKYMTARQASEYCGLSPKYIKVLAERGLIGSTRAGVKVLVVVGDLDEYLEKNKKEKING